MLVKIKYLKKRFERKALSKTEGIIRPIVNTVGTLLDLIIPNILLFLYKS